MGVRWWRVAAVWPLAYTLSVASTVVVTLGASVVETRELGVPGDTGYLAIWIAVLGLVPAVVVGAPVLAAAAVALRGAGPGWQVAAVGLTAGWVAALGTAVLNSPWGPFRSFSIDPAAPYPWAQVAQLAAIAAIGWGTGTGGAWALVRPVGPVGAPRAGAAPLPTGARTR